jgi:hypothetical protein
MAADREPEQAGMSRKRTATLTPSRMVTAVWMMQASYRTATSRIPRRMPLHDSALTQNSSAASLGVLTTRQYSTRHGPLPAPPPPPVVAPVGKGKAPIGKGKGKGPAAGWT